MIGGLKLSRAGGSGVNANELEEFPISLLLSPLTTVFLSKGVGAQGVYWPRPPRRLQQRRASVSLSVGYWMHVSAKGFAHHRKLTEWTRRLYTDRTSMIASGRMRRKQRNLTQVAVRPAELKPSCQEKTPRRVGLGVRSFYESTEERRRLVDQHRCRIFHQLLDSDEEQDCLLAVDDAVVV
jgi:hypothetical protein